MKKQFVTIFLTLLAIGLFTVSAMAQLSSHSVWTQNNGRQITDPDLPCNYTTITKFRVLSSWTEKTPGYPAQAHFRGFALSNRFNPCGAHTYEFTLTQSSVTSFNNIEGDWDVYRDGSLVCSACNGSANGLSQAAGVGNYYKVTIDDPVYGPGAWFFSGYIDVRDDF
jgi:hypothetical protein